MYLVSKIVIKLIIPNDPLLRCSNHFLHKSVMSNLSLKMATLKNSWNYNSGPQVTA